MWVLDGMKGWKGELCSNEMVNQKDWWGNARPIPPPPVHATANLSSFSSVDRSRSSHSLVNISNFTIRGFPIEIHILLVSTC